MKHTLDAGHDAHLHCQTLPSEPTVKYFLYVTLVKFRDQSSETNLITNIMETDLLLPVPLIESVVTLSI